jgi:hypothetical protein
MGILRAAQHAGSHARPGRRILRHPANGSLEYVGGEFPIDHPPRHLAR